VRKGGGGGKRHENWLSETCARTGLSMAKCNTPEDRRLHQHHNGSLISLSYQLLCRTFVTVCTNCWKMQKLRILPTGLIALVSYDSQNKQ
jgi:hypothetical protein